jgi:hypothetical protein
MCEVRKPAHNAAMRSQGISVLECTAALALLAAGFIFTAQVLGVWAKQRLAADQLLVAQLEAANAVEHIVAMPFERINSSTLAETKLPQDTQATLIGGRLTATVEESTDRPRYKRIVVEVAWPAGEGPPRTVKLTAWKYDLPPPGN